MIDWYLVILACVSAIVGIIGCIYIHNYIAYRYWMDMIAALDDGIATALEEEESEDEESYKTAYKMESQNKEVEEE